MKKIAIIAGVLIGGALLISAAVFFAVSHLIEAGELRRYLIHEFEARTGLKVEVGETRVALGRVMGVSFENLVLRDPAENRAILTAPLISMRVALLPLVRRQVVFHGLRFDRPRAQRRQGQGGQNALARSAAQASVSAPERRGVFARSTGCKN